MRKIIAIVILFGGALGLFSCNGNSSSETANEGLGKLRPAKGGRYYGGIFNLSEPEYIKNLYPHNIIDAYSFRVASQVYEGLFKFEQDSLKVIPSLAERYEMDTSLTVYTIHLRKGVKFHDDDCFDGGKGRELKAQDVKYCFSKLCTQYPSNQGFHIFDGILKGAKTYYDASRGGKTPTGDLEGIKIIDDYTIEFTLNQPNSLFLAKLARPETFIFPKEAFDKYGIDMRIRCVGTGPFQLKPENVDEDASLILLRNPNYHRKDQYGNQLPFLQAIKVRFINDKQMALLDFKQKKLDMMYRLPAAEIFEILSETSEDPDGPQGKYVLQREPEMQTQILAFRNDQGVFKDKNLRKAFSYAINREMILDYVLNKQGFKAGINGITPPSFPEYDIDQIQGYTYNPDSAVYFLRKAGYSDGKDLKVTLDYNAEGNRNTRVVNEIKKQIKEVLNVDIELNLAPHSHITEKCTSGDFALIRLSWIADFPSPEAFLLMFHSKYITENGVSYPNIARYTNPNFDKLYDQAITAGTQAKAMQKFMQAEQTAMEDAPIMVLWYDEAYRLLLPRVQNFPNNPMQYRDFSEVYLEPEEENNTK